MPNKRAHLLTNFNHFGLLPMKIGSKSNLSVEK